MRDNITAQMDPQPITRHCNEACRRAAAISAVGENLTLYAHLVDLHQWHQMHRVFIPTMYLSMPEPHFEDIRSLDQFQAALRDYATWNMQHAIMNPLVQFDEHYTHAHAETHFIGTIFDRDDPKEARPEEVEYGSWVTESPSLHICVY